MSLFKPTKKGNLKKYFSAVILIAAVLFFIITNLIWLSIDTLPPSGDQAKHLNVLLEYHRSLKSLKIFGVIQNPSSPFGRYPPFFYASTLPVIFILGFSEDHAIFVNFFYIILLIFSVYGIGKILFDKRTGILAALLTLFYPVVFGLSREYLLDFALLAMVSFVQYLILKSEGGLKKYWNFLLGVAVVIAVLTKPNSLIFILPTWAYALFKYFRKNKLTPLVIVLVPFFILTLYWCIWPYLRGWLEAHNNFNIIKAAQFQAQRLAYHPHNLIESFLCVCNELKYGLLSPNLLQFFLVGLILFLIWDRRQHIFLFLIIWIMPACIGLIFWPIKDYRYIAPVLPAFALFTIGGVSGLPKFIKNMLYFMIIFISFLQFCNLSFHFPFKTVDEQHYYYNHQPLNQDWKIREILDSIGKLSDNNEITIGILANTRYFQYSNFKFYVNWLRLPYRVVEIDKTGKRDLVKFKRLKREVGILVVKFPIIEAPDLFPSRAEFYNEFMGVGANNLDFEKVDEWNLPDYSKAIIYRNMRGRK